MPFFLVAGTQRVTLVTRVCRAKGIEPLVICILLAMFTGYSSRRPPSQLTWSYIHTRKYEKKKAWRSVVSRQRTEMAVECLTRKVAGNMNPYLTFVPMRAHRGRHSRSRPSAATNIRELRSSNLLGRYMLP